MGAFNKLLECEDMSILQKLLEYEDPSSQGIPLTKSEMTEYDPTQRLHHRYHKTKAGLYVVLRHHKDGAIQKLEHATKGSASFSCPNNDGQDESLPELFTFKGNQYHFNTAFNRSITKSIMQHHSRIRIAHVTDSLDETILSVELNGWMKFEKADLPTWRLRIQRNPLDTPYRSDAYPAVEGNIYSYQKHDLEPDGRVKTASSAPFEGKRLDYESSVNNILILMELYFVSRNRENMAQHLNSPDCLIFG